MNVDWSKAPDWAVWMAMDEDGHWYFYEHKPVAGIEEWRNVASGKFERADKNPWKSSLRMRPKDAA